MSYRLARWVSAVCALFLLCTFCAAGKDKTIRLRNETIVTHAPEGKAPGQARPGGKPGGGGAGLLVVQFQEPPTGEQLQELGRMGVQVVRYVPEDAYIVRVKNVTVEQIGGLGFVQYVGEYRPDHKVHGNVRKALEKRGQDELYVSVMFSPLATKAEVDQARREFRSIRQESHLRQGAVLRGHVPKGQLKKLADDPNVLWIEPGPQMKLFDEISSDIVAGEGGVHSTFTQMSGYDGTGVTVAVADSGLDTGEADTMHPDLFGRTPEFFYYGNLTDPSDEHSHGTHVSGIIAGNGAVGEVDEFDMLYGLGVAPNARIVTQRIFDGIGNYEAPPSFGTLTRDAVQAGAEIGSNSWGDDTQGQYDTSAAEFDALVRDADETVFGDQQYILEFSAGNAGPDSQTIGSPAVGKNVIATGASQNNRLEMLLYAEGMDAMADFSSRGPAADGRIKPDITAPGTWISSAFSAYAPEDNTWGAISGNYAWMSGTSQAGPHASGAAAVFVQFYRQQHGGTNPSPALVKAALINSAVDMDDSVETEAAPNNDEGWGRIDLTEIIGSERLYQYVDQTERLGPGQVYEHHVLVGIEEAPLKFTLTYTDFPGLPSAALALVNDLDLEVVAPDGRVYHGNRFVDGESIPNVADYDTINNVEGVHLNEPMSGEYIVRVRARRVVEDAIADTPGVLDQDFALVVSGDLLSTSASLIALDRRAYTAPGRINVKMFHPPLAGQSMVSAQVSSTTELNAEPLTLRAMGNGGVFTGSVATVTGFATIDGRLQVRNGDTIQVLYHGTTPPVTLSAVAVADLAAPQISDVLTWNRFRRTFIAWDTDERADGVVRFGTSPQSLTMALTNSFYRDYQEVALMDLTPGVTYYYIIEARDQAGNMAVDDNNGQGYTFVPQPAATALVVDAYYNDLFAVPPLSGYTVALDQAGIGYETWEVEFEGTPTAADLRPFPLVIWRVPEFGLETTLPAGARQAITNYLASGGSLLMASMELTSRLDEGSAGWFRSNVLHVAEYNPDVFLPVMTGAPNEPISSGLSVAMDYTDYEDEIKEWMGITADASDTITAGPGAVPIFFNDVNPVGVRYPQTGVDVPGRVIFLSTALDAIPLSGTAPNTRAHILGNMISFLVPGINGIGTISMDRSQYTLPSVIRIEVADSDLKGQGQVTVQIFSDTEPGGQQVRLYETGRKGVFQGSINLVSAENAPAADRLRAAAGDEIWAEYNDASLGNTNRISAVVDMVPCVITGVEAFPDYVDGWVMWETSEPADSLVQFGKTRMLDRVAYWPEFTFSHELLLTGLEPDQTYYYRVVSRDLAGNTTIDDNSTNLYTFRTQHPTYPPWQDDLELGGDQWTVYTGEDSDGLGWEWGVPANGVEMSAHSPANAWGSSLNGEAITWMQTFLISPPIYITGGNNATLNFWHSYDFTERDMGDLSEGGAVLILTNQYSDYILLGQFGMDEYSYGWEEANFDLTPYVGQVVYLVWYYELLTFPMDNVANRPGWLVDDISVSVANVIPGTLVVTNNIWQASFDVNGPIRRSGRGTSLVITNAPPGEYTISYLDVPFYLKPPADTKVLASSGAISFPGNYQMIDANNNGISDSWETQYFGSVSPNRTQTTDSDGDGRSDYAEFLAGTDPRVSNSVFAVTRLLPLGNGTVRLEWVSAKNRGYRVEATRDLRTWTPVSDWVHALSTTSYYILPQPGPDDPWLYRVLLQP